MSAPEPSRRALLSGVAGSAAAATAGCLESLRSRITYNASDQVSLTLATVPADRDPESVLIGQELRDNLSAVGIDVAHRLVDETTLLRDAFVNHDFDLFLTEFPGHAGPDDLRSFLHSRFAGETGYQNPFGLADREIDRLLERQRRPDTVNRRTAVRNLLHAVLRSQPFVVIAARDRTTALATDLEIGAGVPFGDTLAYLLLDSQERDLQTLNVGLQRGNVAENRNVLSIPYRLHDPLTDLCYDPLVREIGDQHVPWLAEEFSIDHGRHAATVTLRPELYFHDGTPLTASDVAFTYRFLSDTALGELESPVPAPRFRSQSSLVESVSVEDDQTLTLDLQRSHVEVAPTALTAPILPAHEWRERSEREHEYFTKAMTADVETPVGSGPLRFEDSEDDQSVTFERNEDHFLRSTEDLPQALEPFADAPAYETLEAAAAPNVGVLLADIASGDVDILDGNLPIGSVEEASERSQVRVVRNRSPSYYMLGMNTRRHPLSNYAFRSVLARLFDREEIVTSVFEGMANATETPLHGTEYVDDSLRWDGESVTGPFPGTDGDLDVEAARDLFREAGFRYHDDTLRER